VSALASLAPETLLAGPAKRGALDVLRGRALSENSTQMHDSLPLKTSSGSLLNATIGDYRLVSFVGEGGMGEVYRAVHAKLDRAVAIKVLSRDAADAGFLERFWNEARLHASLHHPNIAELYDFLEHDGRPCIVMEYVDGQTLSDRLRAGRLPPAEALPIFRAITTAMAYVHEQGIVHRDLKAANVRISSRGVVKLLDFGIAKGGTTPSLTQTGVVIGTLLYMAPEQLRGEPATPRSDVWSLGVLLYEMVVGRLPFRADVVGELIDRLASDAYDRPSAACALPPGAPPAPLLASIDRIVGRCLRRNPADRYASAGHLARDLEAALTEDRAAVSWAAAAPTARPAPVSPSLVPAAAFAWLARVRAHALPLAGVLAVLIAILAYAVWPSSPVPAPIGTKPPAPPAVAAQEPDKTTHRIDVAEGPRRCS
jgi:eukaryotic-like serine/threonine-protein kinase